MAKCGRCTKPITIHDEYCVEDLGVTDCRFHHWDCVKNDKTRGKNFSGKREWTEVDTVHYEKKKDKKK